MNFFKMILLAGSFWSGCVNNGAAEPFHPVYSKIQDLQLEINSSVREGRNLTTAQGKFNEAVKLLMGTHVENGREIGINSNRIATDNEMKFVGNFFHWARTNQTVKDWRKDALIKAKSAVDPTHDQRLAMVIGISLGAITEVLKNYTNNLENQYFDNIRKIATKDWVGGGMLNNITKNSLYCYSHDNTSKELKKILDGQSREKTAVAVAVAAAPEPDNTEPPLSFKDLLKQLPTNKQFEEKKQVIELARSSFEQKLIKKEQGKLIESIKDQAADCKITIQYNLFKGAKPETITEQLLYSSTSYLEAKRKEAEQEGEEFLAIEDYDNYKEFKLCLADDIYKNGHYQTAEDSLLRGHIRAKMQLFSKIYSGKATVLIKDDNIKKSELLPLFVGVDGDKRLVDYNLKLNAGAQSFIGANGCMSERQRILSNVVEELINYGKMDCSKITEIYGEEGLGVKNKIELILGGRQFFKIDQAFYEIATNGLGESCQQDKHGKPKKLLTAEILPYDKMPYRREWQWDSENAFYRIKVEGRQENVFALLAHPFPETKETVYESNNTIRLLKEFFKREESKSDYTLATHIAIRGPLVNHVIPAITRVNSNQVYIASFESMSWGSDALTKFWTADFLSWFGKKPPLISNVATAFTHALSEVFSQQYPGRKILVEDKNLGWQPILNYNCALLTTVGTFATILGLDYEKLNYNFVCDLIKILSHPALNFK